MRKVIYPKIGGVDSIEITDTEDPLAAKGDVVVRIHRAGINFADLMMRQGLYGSNPDFPFTPGYEASGVITNTGEGVYDFEVGDRVLAMTGFGGYSEKISIPSKRVFKLPDNVTFDQAAAIPVTYGTAYHMLFHLGRISPGDTVLIHHAAGGVGLSLIHI